MKAKIVGLIILFFVFSIASNSFSAQFNFTPRSSVSQEYTDNVFLNDDDKKDDFITTPSAGFTASLLGRTSGLELSADPGYSFYNDFTDNNGWRLPASLRAWTSPSKATRFEIRDDFIRTEDPIDPADRVSIDDAGRVEETGDTTARENRETYYRNTARFRFSHQFGKEDQVYAGFDYGLLRNNDDQEEDNNNYTPYLGLNYWFTQRYGSEFNGTYTRGEFDQSSGFDGDPSSDFDNWNGAVGFIARLHRHFSLFTRYNQIYRHYINGDDDDYLVYAPSVGFIYDIGDSYLRLGLGYYYQDIDNQDSQDDPFINGEISKIWNFKRGLINLTGLAGLDQNDFGAQNIGLERFASILSSAVYNFTPKFVADLSAYYRFSSAPGDSDQADEGDRDDHRAQFNAGLSYLPTRWLTLRLGYEFNYYNSSEDDDYQENRGLLTITLQPDRPWKF